MFPESVRNKTATVVEQTTSGMKTFYSYSRSAVWIVFSTSLILFAPVIFEVERAQMEEMQRTQQKQVNCLPVLFVINKTYSKNFRCYLVRIQQFLHQQVFRYYHRCIDRCSLLCDLIFSVVDRLIFSNLFSVMACSIKLQE